MNLQEEMKNSKKKTKGKVKKIVIKPKNIDIVLHEKAANDVDLFLTILSRKEDRLGWLVDYSQNPKSHIKPARKAYKLAILTDALIKSMYRHGKEYLKLNMTIKNQ